MYITVDDICLGRLEVIFLVRAIPNSVTGDGIVTSSNG